MTIAVDLGRKATKQNKQIKLIPLDNKLGWSVVQKNQQNKGKCKNLNVHKILGIMQ